MITSLCTYVANYVAIFIDTAGVLLFLAQLVHAAAWPLVERFFQWLVCGYSM